MERLHIIHRRITAWLTHGLSEDPEGIQAKGVKEGVKEGVKDGVVESRVVNFSCRCGGTRGCDTAYRYGTIDVSGEFSRFFLPGRGLESVYLCTLRAF